MTTTEEETGNPFGSAMKTLMAGNDEVSRAVRAMLPSVVNLSSRQAEEAVDRLGKIIVLDRYRARMERASAR